MLSKAVRWGRKFQTEAGVERLQVFFVNAALEAPDNWECCCKHMGALLECGRAHGPLEQGLLTEPSPEQKRSAGEHKSCLHFGDRAKGGRDTVTI